VSITRFIVIVIGLLLPLTGGALPWYVPDEQTSQRLSAVLDELWFGHPLEIVVGDPVPDQDGVWVDGTTVVLITEGEEIRAAASEDLGVQALLVRSLLNPMKITDEGWVPPPREEEEKAPQPVVPFFYAAVGSELRFLSGQGVLHLNVGGGIAWRRFAVGPDVAFAVGGEHDWQDAEIRSDRYSVGGYGSWIPFWRPVGLEIKVVNGLRAVIMWATTDSYGARNILMPYATFSASVYSPPIGKTRFMLTTGITTDRQVNANVGETTIVVGPAAVFAEIGVHYGNPGSRKN
jgi:hypothetical protein